MTTTNTDDDGAPKPQSPPTPSLNEHLSFPSFEPESPAESSSPPLSQPRQVLKDRLYVGNLHSSVDEYSLLQVFSKFGKVTHLDFLFHKAGIMKGKPRGYAFIEYGSNHEALKALTMAHDKLLRGRKLVVTFAHQAPIEAGGSGALKRKSMMETGRPTTLSIIKTGMGTRTGGTGDKIAMMEAKLRQMEATKPRPVSAAQPDQAGSMSRPRLMPYHHSSLPPKPPPQIPTNMLLHPHGSGLQQPHSKRPKPSVHVPPLPILPSSQSTPSHYSRPAKAAPSRSKTSKFVGVKIGKPKDKVTRPEEDS